MPSIDLEQGRIHYEEAGPSDGRPVVLVHGFLMAADVWGTVPAALAERGLRVLAPTWPMGAHHTPVGGDLAPRAMARLVAGFLDALDLRDVVLVGNDSGGAVAQVVAAHHGERLGALVLTNCDTLEHFPPTMFKPLVTLARTLTAFKAPLQTMRAAAGRRSPLGYGLLTHADIDHLARAWVAPALADDQILDDARRFVLGMQKEVTLDAAERLKAFGRPITLVWGADDKLFTLAQAQRFAATVGDVRLEVVEGARTLPMLDQPDRTAELIGEAAQIAAPA